MKYSDHLPTCEFCVLTHRPEPGGSVITSRHQATCPTQTKREETAA